MIGQIDGAWFICRGKYEVSENTSVRKREPPLSNRVEMRTPPEQREEGLKNAR